MNKLIRFFALLVSAGFMLSSCNNESKTKESQTMDSSNTVTNHQTQIIVEHPVSYSVKGINFNSYVAFDSAQTGKRPVVLVLPEWWGMTEYPRKRAKQLAELGYLAMAVDLYGDGKIAGDPVQAQTLATPFYKDPQLGKERFEAALSTAMKLEQADTTKTAAIGYCFGGTMVLNAAKMGSNLDGVVSFHGGLETVPANKDLLKAKILICHGAADSFVPQAQVDAFKKGLDSIGASYTFKAYPDATHAFTNPAATETGVKFKMPIRYNGAADTASWNDMKSFLKTLF
ncbi:MAG TPA: dienelactone hydrolase family protein [Flavisolibacter sp.]|jgi:dienelactone hydrolase|nr:dienelactone hydrolase family protein [Flavisolibacter sp.]